MIWQDKVVVNIASMLTDEKVYRNATTFDPHRWLPEYTDAETLKSMKQSYMQFGSGPRSCPGYRLAMVEAISSIASVLRCFNVKLACDASELRFVTALATRLSNLPLMLEPRVARA